MKALKPFDIAFVGLSEGLHEFSFELTNDFFDCFEGHESMRSELMGKLMMHKKSNMLDFEFTITGRVELECDRCLEPFWYKMDIHEFLYVKFGDHLEEQSEEVIIIPNTDTHFDVSQYFYEFVMLGIPIRKVHEEIDGKMQCNPDIVAKLEKYNHQNKSSSPNDSRWDALKNLKFN